MIGFTASTLLAAEQCVPSSAFFGFMGVTSAIVFANLGSAYGTAKAGVGISSMGVMRPDLVMRSIIPVVMAGILGIYGLITAVIINGKLDKPASYSQYSGYAHLGAGLTVGLSSLAAGLAIGIVGDAGVRANAQQPKLFVGMILILIFAEALALYGMFSSVSFGIVCRSDCRTCRGIHCRQRKLAVYTICLRYPRSRRKCKKVYI